MAKGNDKIEHLRKFTAGMPRMKHAAAALLLAVYAAAAVASSSVGSAVICGLGAAFASAILAAVTFAYRRAWILAAPLLSSALTLLLTHSVPYTLMSLLPIPVAAAIVISFALKRKKSGIITAASVAVAVWLILILLTAALMGEIELSYESFTAMLKSSLMSMTVRTADGPAPLFTEALADGLVQYITLSLPAIVSVCAMAVAFLAASLFPRLLYMLSFGQYVYRGSLVYTPTAIAGAVYLIAVAMSASLAVDASYDMLGFIAENILLLLMPAMLLYGMRVIVGFAITHDKRFLIVVIGAILFFSLPSMFLMIVTFAGALHIIYVKLSWTMKKLARRMRDDDDDYDGSYDSNDDDDSNDSDDSYYGGFFGWRYGIGDDDDDDDNDESSDDTDDREEPRQNDYGDRFR